MIGWIIAYLGMAVSFGSMFAVVLSRAMGDSEPGGDSYFFGGFLGLLWPMTGALALMGVLVWWTTRATRRKLEAFFDSLA